MNSSIDGVAVNNSNSSDIHKHKIIAASIVETELVRMLHELNPNHSSRRVSEIETRIILPYRDCDVMGFEDYYCSRRRFADQRRIYDRNETNVQQTSKSRSRQNIAVVSTQQRQQPRGATTPASTTNSIITRRRLGNEVMTRVTQRTRPQNRQTRRAEGYTRRNGFNYSAQSGSRVTISSYIE